jgi:hypothetical protein
MTNGIGTIFDLIRIDIVYIYMIFFIANRNNVYRYIRDMSRKDLKG